MSLDEEEEESFIVFTFQKILTQNEKGKGQVEDLSNKRNCK